ncbi:ferredoxin [Streptomyces sp. NBC_00441]|uniref:ferredoxin n=1 Tax=Streptomyces sp. NBC_00441 TaxID=2975742 RepID=UPI002E287323|nr:ferredoxin [Streptomyces sp. NBC_00441]
MKIEINRAACEGHGLCEQTAPDVYALDEEGYAYVRVPEIPAGLQPSAEAGARVCPVAALQVHR